MGALRRPGAMLQPGAMTLEEARKVLGLEPDGDLESRLGELAVARERLADLAAQAPNETIALRYQDGLVDFDRALAVVREQVAESRQRKMAPLMSLVPGAVSGRKVVTKRDDFHAAPRGKAEPEAGEATRVEPSDAGEREEAEPIDLPTPRPEAPPTEPVLPKPMEVPREEEAPRRRRLSFALYLLLFVLVGGIGGGWLYYHVQAEKEVRRQAQLAHLEKFGSFLVENRRWEEARAAFGEIGELDPGSEVAMRGMRSIEVGMEEEQQQFVGYWSGEALAAFEAGRLDAAAEAVAKVLERYPGSTTALELDRRIESARIGLLRESWEGRLNEAIEARDWEAADGGLVRMAEELPGDELIAVLSSRIAAAKDRQRREHERARQLAGQARQLDKGEFNAQALEWMREAVSLAPEDAEIRELYDRLASYTRTLRVPEDVATLAAALGQVRDKDRVVLGEGEFEGGVAINVAVQLEGAGEGKTVVRFAAREGPAVTLGPGASGATLTGITFRQEGFDPSEERFPAALVRGGEVEFVDCTFLEGSGHGLAVLEGGHGQAVRCKFRGNGWDGVAARGKGSRMTLRECLAERNFGHGFEIWDGAAAVIRSCQAKDNSRNGIHVDSAAEGLELRDNTLSGNREYGVVLGAGASGTVAGNRCRGNLLGGLLVRFAAISVRVESNRLESNRGPGLLLEQGLRPDLYSANTAVSNRGGNVASGLVFERAD